MIRTWVAVGAVVLALSGCGGEPLTSAQPTAGSEQPRVRVLAAFYPYWYVAQRVGGDRASVGLMTEPGVEPHDLELSPRQVAEIGEVDLVIYQKGFQPAVDETVAQQAAEKQLDVNAALGRAPVADDHDHEGETAEEHAEHAEADAHDGETAEEHAEHADEDTHEHGDLATDPHIWLDPDLYSRVATATADALSRIDPAGSAEYQQRAAGLRADLVTLDSEFRSGLGSCARRTVVVNHAAFGHLTERYGLEQVGINGLSPDAAPSPQHLNEVAEQIRSDGTTTVFTETLASPRLAETLANEAGVRTATLDPLEGLAREDSRDFFSVMRDNLDALRTGLDCTGTAPTTPPPPPSETPSPTLGPEPTVSTSPSETASAG